MKTAIRLALGLTVAGVGTSIVIVRELFKLLEEHDFDFDDDDV